MEYRSYKKSNTTSKTQAQQQQDVATIDRFVAMLQGRVGPQITNLLIKQQDMAKFIAKKLGVPEELIRSDEEMIEAGQQLQQMGANMQQQGIDPKQASDVAKSFTG